MFNFDKQFFEKHQTKLLFVANRWYLRWLLGLNRLPREIREKKIDKITPNSIHHLAGKAFSKNGKYRQKIKAEFFARPRFAEALAYNLSLFCYFQNVRQKKMTWRFSPIGLIGCLLVALYPKSIGGFCFFGTTSTYYVSSDNDVNSDSQSSWAAAYGAVTGVLRGGDKSYPAAQKSTSGSTYYFVGTYMATIDTSSINGIVTGVSLNIVSAGKTGGNDRSYNVYNSNHSDTVATTDFDLRGSTEFSTAITQSSWAADGSSITYTGNSAFISAVSRVGYTKFCIREVLCDVANTSPSNNELNYVVLRNSTYTGSASDPYLSVSYNSSGSIVGYFPLDGNALDYKYDKHGSVDGAVAVPSQNKFIPASLAYKFDGTNDYISHPNIAGIKTAIFWAKPTAASASYLQQSASIYISDSSGTLSATGWTSPKIYVNGSPSTTIKIGRWQLVVVTSSTAVNGSVMYIGKQNASYLTGQMQEVAYLSRELSAQEISQLYCELTGIGNIKSWIATFGNAYSAVLSEAIKIGNAVNSKITAKIFAEILKITTIFLRNIFFTILNIAKLSNVISIAKVFLKELSDTIKIIDNFSKKITAKILSETIKCGNAILRAFSFLKSEVIKVGNVIDVLKAYFQYFSESLKIGNIFVIRRSAIILSDMIKSSNTILRLSARTLSQTVFVDDIITLSRKLSTSLSEVIKIVSSATVNFIKIITLSQTFKITSRIIMAINGLITGLWRREERDSGGSDWRRENRDM